MVLLFVNVCNASCTDTPQLAALGDPSFSEYGLLDLETDLSLGPLLPGSGSPLETGDLLSPFCSQSMKLAVDIDNIFDICDNSDSSSLGSVGSPENSLDNSDSSPLDSPENQYEIVSNVNNNDVKRNPIRRVGSTDSDTADQTTNNNTNNAESDNTRHSRKRNKRYRYTLTSCNNTFRSNLRVQ
jgi:hypothetical protein